MVVLTAVAAIGGLTFLLASLLIFANRKLHTHTHTHTHTHY